MDIHIHIEKKHFVILAVLLAFAGVMFTAQAADVNINDAWHPLQQIARNDTDMTSVDQDWNGRIDKADKSYGLDAESNVDMNGYDILNGNVCPDGNCDVNNYETFTSSGIGTTSIYSGSGGEIDFWNQVNFNANPVRGLRNVYGDSGSDILFRDRPQSRDGLYIRSGTAYFNDEIRTDVIQDRGGGNTIRSDSHLNMNNNKITNLDDPDNDHDAATKKYVDDNGGKNVQRYQSQKVRTNMGNTNTEVIATTSEYPYCALSQVQIEHDAGDWRRCMLFVDSGKWKLRADSGSQSGPIRCYAMCFKLV